MSIYTTLIEQTKKEIDKILFYERGNPLTKIERLETLQLAEKMHEEFVEKLKQNFIDDWEFLKKANATPYLHCRRIIEEINRLSNSPQNNQGKTPTIRAKQMADTQTQKGKFQKEIEKNAKKLNEIYDRLEQTQKGEEEK